MCLWKKIVFILLCAIGLLNYAITFSAVKPGFEAAEHMVAGEQIQLYFDTQHGQKDYLLHLNNGLTLTFSQIIALSGDYYAVLGETISESKTIDERKSKFIAAYQTLAEDPATVSEVPKILAVMQKEHQDVIEGMQRGEKPEAIYARIGDDNNRQWNCITGGGCSSMWWLTPGRYLNLSREDYDHFGDNAWLAYQAGHQVAIETAITAHQTQNIKLLESAYTMDAYACHFLSDRFSSGHMRVPRVQLHSQVTPQVLGDLLVRFMHNEENQNGVHVHNLRGDRWIAFGDRYYFSVQNKDNRNLLEKTLQESINQIFYAYQQGNNPEVNDIYALLPIMDEINGATHQDIAPLFYWEQATQTIYRRSDITNPYDNHYTSDWWGWSTVVLLSNEKGLPTESQQELIAAGYGKEAMQRGLIKDKSLVAFVKHGGYAKAN
jgi:hypothetical protein